MRVGDVVILPQFCETDRRDFPCPCAGERAIVTQVIEWMPDVDAWLINVELPRPVACEYWGATAGSTEPITPSDTCCLYSTDVKLVAPRGDPRGNGRLF